MRERAKLAGLTRGSEERRRLLQRLKSLVCQPKQRHVCCEVPGQGPADPDSPSYLPSLEDEECGVEGGNPAFVLGGQDTGIGEFPFLGLLGKRRGKGRKIEWECGGSIINKVDLSNIFSQIASKYFQQVVCPLGRPLRRWR